MANGEAAKASRTAPSSAACWSSGSSRIPAVACRSAALTTAAQISGGQREVYQRREVRPDAAAGQPRCDLLALADLLHELARQAARAVGVARPAASSLQQWTRVPELPASIMTAYDDAPPSARRWLLLCGSAAGAGAARSRATARSIAGGTATLAKRPCSGCIRMGDVSSRN